MAIQNVALVGASGTLGPHILSALKAHPTLTPYVLNRQTSKSVYPRTNVITVPDDLDPTAVSQLLREKKIDAVVIAIAGSYVAEQKKLIDAAYQGGVKRIMPAEFGSCDSADEKTNEILPLMKGKKDVREYLISVCNRTREGGNLTWTSLVTGHFFDWGLGNGLMKFDVPARKAYLLDGGDIKISASTLPFIAEAVVRILERPEQTENKMLYVHSHYVTQLDILAALEKVTGEKFERIEQQSDTLLAEVRPKMLEGDGEAREEVVAIWGCVGSDWGSKEGLANEVLGLEMEDLEEMCRGVAGGSK